MLLDRRSLLSSLGLLALLTLLVSPLQPSPLGPSEAEAQQEPVVESDRKPFLREQYFHEQRALPGTEIPPGALLRARQQLQDRVRGGALAVAPQGQFPAAEVNEGVWTSLGPQPIGLGSSGFGTGQLPNSGRVTAVAVVDATTVYVGAATGGVWKTTDSGAT